MRMTGRDETNYILGHSDAELRRLQAQAAILRPITERLLRSAGIRRGMRVVDLGSGAGDVTMLAAELVGPSGWVDYVTREKTQRIPKSSQTDVSTFLHTMIFNNR